MHLFTLTNLCDCVAYLRLRNVSREKEKKKYFYDLYPVYFYLYSLFCIVSNLLINIEKARERERQSKIIYDYNISLFSDML